MQLDEWFDKYKKFVSQFHLLDQPQLVYTPDKCGFSRGDKLSSVIGIFKNCPRYPPYIFVAKQKMQCFMHMLKLSPQFYNFSLSTASINIM